jgi:hypothetical protein
MEKTLLDLVEFLKSGGLDHAVFNWSAQDRISDWFDAAAYMEGACIKIAEDYGYAVADFLREHYPKFDHFLGTYGEVYVYPSGKVEIVLTERVYGEEYHRKSIDLTTIL